MDGLRRVTAFPLEQDGLFVEPLFDLLGRQLLRRVDGFLPGVDALAVVVIAHGDHDEIAAAEEQAADSMLTMLRPDGGQIFNLAAVCPPKRDSA